MFICLTVCSRRYGFESHRPVQKQLLVMKQFNLDEYLQNPSRPVVTRDGRKVRILCTDRAKSDFSIVALAMNNDGYESVDTYRENGKYHHYSPKKSDNDLFFATIKKEGWMNLYNRGFGLVKGSAVYETEEEAKKIAAEVEDHITTIKVEWEE